jgi:hypothetical protein
MRKNIMKVISAILVFSLLPISTSLAAKKSYPKGDLKVVQTGVGEMELRWSYTSKSRPSNIYLVLNCADYSVESCNFPSNFKKDQKDNYVLKINKSLRSFKIKGLTPAAIYDFSLYSEKSLISKSKIDDIVAKVEKQLSAPRELKAEWSSNISETFVNVTWLKPFGYTGGYTLDVFTAANNKLFKSYKIDANLEKFTIKDLSVASSYKFVLYGKEVINGVKAEYSISSIKPESIIGFDLVGLSESSIKVIWSKPLIKNLFINFLVKSETQGLLRLNDKIKVSADTGEYVITGLSKGGAYEIEAFLSNNIADGAKSSKLLTVVAQPGIVTSLTATPAVGSSLELSWVKPESDGGLVISDYIIEYKLTSSTNWSTHLDGVSLTTSTKILDLLPGSSYNVRVASVNANGVSSYNTVIASTFSVPSAPVNLISTIVDVNSVNLTWSAPSNNGGTAIIDYIVEFSNDNGSNWLVFNDGISAGVSVKVTGLTALATYSFRVIALNDAGRSTPSNVASSTMSTLPGAPKDLLLISTTDSSVEFSWSSPVDNGGREITDYTIEYSVDGSGVWTTFTDTVSPVTRVTVTGLLAAKAYLFRVKSVTAAGSSIASNPTLSATTLGGLPSAPVNLVASSLSSQVQLSWSVPVNIGGTAITDYIIEQSSNAGATWVLVPETVSTSTSYTVTGLTNGSPYQFRVKAVNSVGTSPVSNIASINVIDVPSAPTSLSASLPVSTEILLNWSTPANINGSQISDYIVEYSTNNGSTFTAFNDGVSTSTSATITGVSASSNYVVRVKARNLAGDSAYSSSVTVTSQPTALIASGTSSTALSLSWTAPANVYNSSILDYIVEYSSNNGVSYTVFNDGVSSSLSANITGLSSGTTYLVRVKAKNALGVSEYSTAVSTSTWGAPSAPLNVTLTVTGANQLTANWDLPTSLNGSNITDYEIDIDSGGGFILENDGVSTVRSYVINGVTAGTFRTIRVRAVNSTGTSTNSLTATAGIYTAPGAPTGLALQTVAGSSTQINASWVAPASTGGSAITDYIIEYSSDGGANYTLVNDGVNTNLSYTISGLTTNTNYVVRVRAKNASGESSNSLTASITTLAVPAAPTALLLTAVGSTQVNATWTAPANNGGAIITDYEINYSSDGGANYITFNDGVSATLAASVTGLTGNTSYIFRVRAINSVGNSAYSSTTTITTGVVTPGAPTNLTLVRVANSSTQLTASWTAPVNTGGGIDDYVIERSTDGVTFTTVVDGVNANTTYVIPGLTPGTNYTVRVRAKNSAGESANSSTATETPGPVISGVVTGLSLTVISSTQINASWTAPADNGGSNITDYIIETSTDGVTFTVFADGVSTATTANITGLTPATSYTIKIIAVNSVGNTSSKNNPTQVAATQS